MAWPVAFWWVGGGHTVRNIGRRHRGHIEPRLDRRCRPGPFRNPRRNIFCKGRNERNRRGSCRAPVATGYHNSHRHGAPSVLTARGSRLRDVRRLPRRIEVRPFARSGAAWETGLDQFRCPPPSGVSPRVNRPPPVKVPGLARGQSRLSDLPALGGLARDFAVPSRLDRRFA